MQTYHYRAVTESGQVRTGRTEALNLADLESRLTQIKLELIEARAKSTGGPSPLRGGPASNRRISSRSACISRR